MFVILDVCYDGGSTFRLKWFLNDLRHSLTQNRRKYAISLHGSRVVYLGRGTFHPGAVLAFFKSVLGKVLSPQN